MAKLLVRDGQENAWRNREETAQGELSLPWIAADLYERFDWEKGGFTDLTEKQERSMLLFLLEYARRWPDGWSRAMAEAVLERQGTECDPLLAYAGLEAYAQTGRPRYREAACGIMDGALKDLRLFSGCFARPGDDAVSLVWNAQVIAALAKAYRVLGGERYLRAAEKTWLFLKSRLVRPNGRLWRRWRDQTPLEEGRLVDYGTYCWALTELYESNFSVSCLREAEITAERMADLLRDQREDDPDGGRGAAVLGLVRLAGVSGEERYREMARELPAGTGPEDPDGLELLGMVEELRPRRELVCASAGRIPAWAAPVGEEYRLNVLAKTRDNSWGLESAAPCVRDMPVPEDGVRLYLCRDGVCETVLEDLLQLHGYLSPED